MKIFLPIVLLVGLQTFAAAEIIRQGTLQARSDGSIITVSWVTDDETNVARFEVERRTGTWGEFGFIDAVQTKGPSLYEFVDHSADNSTNTLYQYRIKIVFSNSSAPVYVGPVTVSHSVSGVRRTWGSIKAMFR